MSGLSKSDILGHVINKIRYYRLKIFSFWCSFYSKIFLSVNKVKYGKGIKAFGIFKLVRTTESKITIGENCTFRSDFTSNLVGINRKCLISTLRRKAEIIIGDNSGFSGTVIAAAGKITIGNNVLCGANTTITDFDWHGIEPDKRNSPPDPKSIVISDNVWIGLNTTILKGVTIGKNSVIGAHSLVVKDIPENVIAAGNPCKVIRKLDTSNTE